MKIDDIPVLEKKTELATQFLKSAKAMERCISLIEGDEFYDDLAILSRKYFPAASGEMIRLTQEKTIAELERIRDDVLASIEKL
jgi:hypothetical protein